MISLHLITALRHHEVEFYKIEEFDKNRFSAKPCVQGVLAARLAGTLYKQFSKEDQYEAARTETTLAIAAWLKAHPRATQHQQQEESETDEAVS